MHRRPLTILIAAGMLLMAACHSGPKQGQNAGAQQTRYSGGREQPVRSAADSVQAAAFPVSDTLPSSFYKHFSGTIAGKAVEVDLQSVNGLISGDYYYVQHKTPIPLMQRADLAAGDSLQFEERDGASEDEQAYPLWKVVFAGGRLQGTWYGKDRKKHYPIRLKEQYPRGMMRLGGRYFEAEYPAFPKQKDSPYYAIRLQYPYALGEDSAARWLNRHIKMALGFDTAVSFQQGQQQWIDRIVGQYREELQGLDSSQLRFGGNTWQDDKEVYVLANAQDYVQLEVDSYEYLGGAHGMPVAINYAFDMRHHKQMRLADITTKDSVGLQHLVEARFRKDYLQPGDSLKSLLFEDHLAANENFFFDEEGITFTYVPYEVAPFAAGFIYVTLPYTQLAGTLTAEFKQRMSIQ